MHWLAIIIWTAYVVVAFILIHQRLAARRTLASANLADLNNPPSISFIVPARDEAGNIIDCLESLLAQEYPLELIEIIVVDDNSSDNTADLVLQLRSRAPNLQLIPAPALPSDWQGKPHACWLGASHAQNEWLCFVDADVRLQPGLLAAAMVDVLGHGADMLSLHPHQEMRSFGERFLMPSAFMGLLILMDFERINNPESRLAMANGQFIMVRSDRYFDFGGHESVRSEVVEDIALARRAKGTGHKIRLLAGGDLIRTRMYATASAIWQGMTRAVVDVAGGPLFALATVGSSLVLGWLPVLLPIALALSTTLGSEAKIILMALSTATALMWYGALGLVLSWYEVPLRYLLLLPFSFSALSLSIADGLVRYFTRRRVWKGRNF
jgi:chlorobactene glucosyltransferase